MAVAYVEVGVKFCEVDGDAAYAVGAVDAAEDAVLATKLGEALVGDADAGLGDDCVVNCEAWVLALGLDFFNNVLKSRAELRVREWVRVLNLTRSCWCRLGDVIDSFAASTVNCGKVDDHITRLVDEVAKDCVGAC